MLLRSFGLCAACTVAFAAETPKLQETRGVIEEVVVTARKRSEHLQEIPASVTVFNAEQIRDARITNIKDFAALTPNLSVASNFRTGLNFVTIRGLITPQVGEAPLAFVVDGVTVPSLEFINQGLQQIERIEVLRGPQGALYGKNAIGGAINIVTRQPTDTFEGAVEVFFAEGSDRRLSAALSGPLADKVRFRLSGHYRDFDGLLDNPFLNEKVDFVDDEFGLQALLAFELGARTALAIHARYSDLTQGANYQTFITREQLEDFSVEPQPNTVGIDESTLWTVSAKLDHSFDLGDLTFIAGFNDADVLFFADGDFTSLPPAPENFFFPLTQDNPIQEDALNLELRLASRGKGRLRWLLGAFYETRDRSVRFDQIPDPTPTERVTRDLILQVDPALVLVGERTVQDTRAYALFGHASYRTSAAVEWSLAVRYDEERREAFDERVPDISAAQRTFKELQPQLAVAWQASRHALLSGTYARGMRSGGLNEFAPTVRRVYDQEISDTFEIGAKTTWRDGRLLLNMALFYTEQDDAQFTRFNPTTFTLENLNVDRVEVRGAEVEFSVRPTPRLTLSLGAGLVDNEIRRNRGIDLLTGLDFALTEGTSMPYVPDYNITGAVDYLHPLSATVELKTRVSVTTLGPRSFDIFESVTGTSDAHTFVNANIGAEAASWALSVFANNLFDEAAPESVALFNPLIRMRNPPRQVGVQASVRF